MATAETQADALTPGAPCNRGNYAPRPLELRHLLGTAQRKTPARRSSPGKCRARRHFFRWISRKDRPILLSVRGYLQMWRYNLPLLIFFVLIIGIVVTLVVFRTHLQPLHGPAPDHPL